MTYSPENWHARFTRFVMLKASDTPYPGLIRSSLQDYWGQMIEVHSPFGALEELCSLNRHEEPRRRNNDPTREVIALVVLESGRWNQLQDLFRVIRTKLRDVEIFVVDEVDGTTMLMNVTNSRPEDSQEAAPAPDDATEATEMKDDAPFLRYTGDPEPEEMPEPDEARASHPESGEVVEPEEAASGYPEDPPDRTLTAEELDSLLRRSDERDDEER